MVGSRLEDDIQSLREKVLNFKSNHSIGVFLYFFFSQWRSNIWIKLFSEERRYFIIYMHYITRSRNPQGCIHQVLLQLLNREVRCLSAGQLSVVEQVWWDSSFPSPYSGKNYFSPWRFWEVSGVGIGVIEHLAHTESFTKLYNLLTSLK